MTAAIAPGSQVTREQADAITQNIRNALERAYGGIEHAWKVRCDIAMGYDSWAEYVSAEFDTDHLAVPRVERAALVRVLRDAGMTQQEIAVSVNVTQQSVSNDLRETEGITNFGNSDSPDIPPKPKRGRPRKPNKPSLGEEPETPAQQKLWNAFRKANAALLEIEELLESGVVISGIASRTVVSFVKLSIRVLDKMKVAYNVPLLLTTGTKDEPGFDQLQAMKLAARLEWQLERCPDGPIPLLDDTLARIKLLINAREERAIHQMTEETIKALRALPIPSRIAI